MSILSKSDLRRKSPVEEIPAELDTSLPEPEPSDDLTALEIAQDLDAGDEVNGGDNRGYPAKDMGLNAKKSVLAWHISAVGRRPRDFIARDCLFGSLFRDHRVPWFRRYVRRPAPWMKEMVDHLPADSHPQALQYVVLHYLHKLHLIRMFETASRAWGDDSEEIKRLSRLWRCPPSTVLVEKKSGNGPFSRCCGLYHLCPWCFARKVTELSECLRKSVVTDTKGKFLVLAKATFAEPFFGINGRWEQADMRAISNGILVRDYYGRYYGLWRERAIETRDYVIQAVRETVNSAFGGMQDGLTTYQMGSAQDSNGRRTYLHDIGFVGLADKTNLDSFKQNPDIASNNDNTMKATWFVENNLWIHCLVVPAEHPSALRMVLAGASWGYKSLGLESSEKKQGVTGALSWQPTFLLDDCVWFPFAEAAKHQHLYHPFGSWKHELGMATTECRESTDRRFRRIQQTRLQGRKQQKGNNNRHRELDCRRQRLLKVAEPLWPQVLGRITRYQRSPCLSFGPRNGIDEQWNHTLGTRSQMAREVISGS